MHFLLIHQAFVLPTEAGSTRHFELIQGCLQRDHQFTVIASSISYLSGVEQGRAKGRIWRDRAGRLSIWKVRPLAALHRSFVWRVLSFLDFMALAVGAAFRIPAVDVVVGTSPPLFQAVSAWAASVRHRCPLVLEIRDLWPDFAVEMGVLKNRILIALSRALESFLYRSAACIVVNSPAYRDYLLSRNVSSEVVCIPNGVDPKIFSTTSDGGEVRGKWGLEGKFVVTYAGALGPANDVDTIVNAAERLQDTPVHFLLVGDGKERKRLQMRAKDLGLTNVTFTGPRPKREMPEILAASDAGVACLLDIPLFRTTYPNKVFDYMAAGKPTILAVDGVIRQVVEAAEGGIFVRPGDPDGLAAAVRKLHADRQLAQTMGRAARRYVTRHFDRTRLAARFEQLLVRIAAESRGKGAQA